MPSFGNHHHHHQLIKITIAIIIKKPTISPIKKECKISEIIQVVGVRTQQRLLLLPWQLYHATLILACVGGGFYQVGPVFGVVTLWMLYFFLFACPSIIIAKQNVNIIYNHHRPPGSSLHRPGGEEGHTSGLSCSLSCCGRNILHFSLGRQREA